MTGEISTPNSNQGADSAPHPSYVIGKSSPQLGVYNVNNGGLAMSNGSGINTIMTVF